MRTADAVGCTALTELRFAADDAVGMRKPRVHVGLESVFGESLQELSVNRAELLLRLAAGRQGIGQNVDEVYAVAGVDEKSWTMAVEIMFAEPAQTGSRDVVEVEIETAERMQQNFLRIRIEVKRRIDVGIIAAVRVGQHIDDVAVFLHALPRRCLGVHRAERKFVGNIGKAQRHVKSQGRDPDIMIA